MKENSKGNNFKSSKIFDKINELAGKKSEKIDDIEDFGNKRNPKKFKL